MTDISDSYISYDLKSPSVVEGLRRHDQSVIDGIASKPYSMLSQVMRSDFKYLEENPKRDEKLKWMLHTQVAVVGNLLNIEEMLTKSAKSRDEEVGTLTDLTYEFSFLMQDLMGLYFDFGYSTWNLLRIFASETSVGGAQITEYLRILVDKVTSPVSLTFGLAHRRSNLAIDVLGNKALAAWIDTSMAYRELMELFYETVDRQCAVFGFQAVSALSGKLLGSTHSAQLAVSNGKNWSAEIEPRGR
jgi:hypothetical protein